MSYTAGVSGLVTVLARWIAEQSNQPVLDARTYGAVLEVLVEAMSKSATPGGEVRDVAA